MVYAILISTAPEQLNKLVTQVIIESRKFLEYRLSKNHPLHAVSDDEALITHLLKTLAQTKEVWICMGILDKTMLWQRKKLSSNQIYHQLVASTARCALDKAALRANQVQMIIESPHTNRNLREDMQKSIRLQTGFVNEQIRFERKNGLQWGRPLQIADYVSWSWFQKFQFEKPAFANIVSQLVICEDIWGVNSDGQLQQTTEMLPGSKEFKEE